MFYSIHWFKGTTPSQCLPLESDSPWIYTRDERAFDACSREIKILLIIVSRCEIASETFRPGHEAGPSVQLALQKPIQLTKATRRVRKWAGELTMARSLHNGSINSGSRRPEASRDSCTHALKKPSLLPLLIRFGVLSFVRRFFPPGWAPWRTPRRTRPWGRQDKAPCSAICVGAPPSGRNNVSICRDRAVWRPTWKITACCYLLSLYTSSPKPGVNVC